MMNKKDISLFLSLFHLEKKYKLHPLIWLIIIFCLLNFIFVSFAYTVLVFFPYPKNFTFIFNE